jgi:hypothetical protein
MPLNQFSPDAVPGAYLSPDGRARSSLMVDYELGGVAIGDPSQGLQVRVWEARAGAGFIEVRPESGGAWTAVTGGASITEISFSFDQNMRPTVAYMDGGVAKHYWYNALTASWTTSEYPGATSPVVLLDDKRDWQSATSDVLLFYLKAGRVMHRVQRERFMNEYDLAAVPAGKTRIVRCGMTDVGRIQLEFGGDPGPGETVGGALVQQNWIYRMGRETPSDTQWWLSSEHDGDAARSLLASDPDERTYITGAGFSKPVYTDNTFLTTPPFPSGSYQLGIPAPDAGMAVAVPDPTETDLVETRAYVSTFVRANGDEGPPGEAVIVSCAGAVAASISGLPAVPGGNFSNIDRRRIYVSTGGDFQRVAEVSVASTTATDDGTTRGAILQTGGSTSKPAWLEPPDDGKGIIELWAGMHGMWRGKQYMTCVPYNPHGWPSEYRRQVPDTIVGSAKFGQNWVLATTGIPRSVTGTSPSAMVDSPIYSSQSCVSKRSVVGVGHGVCWAGPKGLSYYGQRGSFMMTEGILTLEQWEALMPETLIGAHWGAWYVGFYNDGTKRAGLMINTLDPKGVIWLTQGAYAIFNDLINGALYLLAEDNEILKWDTGTILQATFKSKVKRHPRATNPGAARIVATEYPVEFSLWADGQIKVNAKVVGSDDAFRLPSGYTAEEFQYQIRGAGPAEGVFVGEEMVDLP